jgi:hypothetical protein
VAARRLLSYFALERPVFGGVESDAVLLTGVFVGTLGRWVANWVQTGEPAWGQLVAGMIASLVAFPTIYYTAGLDKSKPTLVKWCVAFQNGYFWPALMEQVGHSFAAR